MKPARLLLIIFTLASLSSVVQAKPDLSFIGPKADQLVEGRSYDIKWSAVDLKSVSVVAAGERTTFPGEDRGSFDIVIANAVPADQGNARWTVPFLDTLKFKVKLQGYDANGHLADSTERTYTFRPEVLANRHANGIYVDVRSESRQRMYALRRDKVIRAYLTSGSRSGDFYPRNIHPSKPHDHPGVFHIQNKYPLWHSRLYDVDMPWAMRYLSGHFIHATSPNLYYKLGTAASSGCNRLYLGQAKELYDMTPIGTRVEIIAPS